MKTEELLNRLSADISSWVDHWPWLVPIPNPDAETVTLFEGVIREDGTVIPVETDTSRHPAILA